MQSNLFLILIFLFTSLYAQEKESARLQTVLSNGEMVFYLRSVDSFYLCKPYGVVTLEDLYERSSNEQVCKKTVTEFYNKKRDLRYFTLNHLKEQQYYNIEIKKDGRCVINSDGMVSLSEKLLQKGVAMVKPNLKDKEYNYLFQTAQKNAQFQKKGLWSSTIKHDCTAQYYKN
jgi:archaeosine-15-forming tRNA-guanine transglycosylase